jgi:hypothetical protein
MFEEEYPGTCRSCGFLGYFDPSDGITRVLHEADAQMRANGYLIKVCTLWCYRRMANINREVEQAEQEMRAAGSFQPAVERDNEHFAAIRQVVSAPRPQCEEQGKWYTYVEFFDPKWHYEDWRMAELERMRQEHTKMLADVQLAILKEQAEIGAEHARTAEAHRVIFERSESQATWFQWAFIFLAVIALVLALLPLAYPDGISWLTDLAPGARNVAPP